MRILFIGDVFGDVGRRVLAEQLGEVQREYAVDFTIANGENCAGGRGITTAMVKKLRKFGVDVITGGNHSTAHHQAFDDARYASFVIRPHNFSGLSKKHGVAVVESKNGQKVAVINLLGKTFMKAKASCPFKAIDAILEELDPSITTIFVDMHAETTSEKICLAHYLTGRVSAVIGTHTHVQTADSRILGSQTAFMSDAGMTGAELSAIGMEHLPIIDRMINGTKTSFTQAKGDPMMNGVVVEVDDTTGSALSITPVFKRYQFKD